MSCVQGCCGVRVAEALINVDYVHKLLATLILTTTAFSLSLFHLELVEGGLPESLAHQPPPPLPLPLSLSGLNGVSASCTINPTVLRGFILLPCSDPRRLRAVMEEVPFLA